MSTLTLTLPEPLTAFIERQVAEGAHPTAEDYIRQLVEEDRNRKARNEVDSLLLEGLQSPASEMTSKDWDTLKDRVRERQAGGKLS